MTTTTLWSRSSRPTSCAPRPFALVEALDERAEHNPALVYLAQLAPGSRPAMGAALETIAQIASGGQADLRSLPRAELRYAHIQALRAALAEVTPRPP